ncbi:MAG: radical SAM family heme chaperone HemW [Selenomonadaceae bacterium]|nr:radical SAM family heme chaperone HemW [Selenomonadaceae bacterium]
MIYIHIPFCKKKCNYCAFNSKIGDEDEKNLYVDALIEEINLRGDDSFTDTIYMGGGTPTTLTLDQLDKIMLAVEENFTVDKRAEITIEANPATVNGNYLRGLQSLGFNRISLGVQTFDDELLKILGRIHDSRAAVMTIELAKRFFNNVSIDLMYGLPNQTLNNLNRDLNFIKALDVRHVSIYGLEIEAGTPFFELYNKNQLNLPEENLCADMYDLITATLPTLGYRRYEISNFAKENFESRHNVGYWTGKSYFGFGAGAHSFDGKLRTSNVCDVATYIKGNVPAIEEVVTRQAAMEEFCFLGLRMVEGISAQIFENKFGVKISDVFGEAINKNCRLGLLKVEDDKISLTERGMALGNEIFADFLL